MAKTSSHNPALKHLEVLVGDVEFFGLLGGGKADGDLAGLPPAQFAVLPATTHVGWAPPYHGIMTRTTLLLPIITEFLDSPMEDGQVSHQPA